MNLNKALDSASQLMGSRRNEMRGLSRGDPDFVPPPEIQKAARDLDRWMKENGHERWQLGDVCSREFVLDLCEAEAKAEAGDIEFNYTVAPYDPNAPLPGQT